MPSTKIQVPIIGGYLNGAVRNIVTDGQPTLSDGCPIPRLYRSLDPCPGIVMAFPDQERHAFESQMSSDYELVSVKAWRGTLELSGWVYAYTKMDRKELCRVAFAYLLSTMIQDSSNGRHAP
jgi:hypothetical protein